MAYPWLENYPRSVPHDVDVDAHRNLVELFENSFNLFRDRSAFTCMGKTLSYSDVDRLSKAFGAYLQKSLGLKKGDRIAIQLPNVLQYPIALYGALRAGLIVVNTNPLYTPREMKHQFNDAGVKAVVILANFAQNLEKIIDETGIEHVIVTELGDQLGLVKGNLVNFVVKHVKKLVPAYKLPRAISFRKTLLVGQLQHLDTPQIESSDIAFLQYTGGTTGVSKGAILTHRNMIANCLQCAAWMSPGTTGQGDLIVTPLPLYHIFSLTVNCLMLSKQGGHNLLIPNPKDIPSFVKELSRYRFNIMTGVNTLFNALMNDKAFHELDFSYFRLCVGGGMAVQSSVAKKWKEVTGVPIIEGYGLTEASPVICCNRVDGFEKMNSIGYPLPSTHVILIDDNGNEVTTLGDPGELCAKGPQIMQGYWQRKEETDKVMHGEYLKTGDIGVMEKDGSYKIVDRKKDMILVSGFNVYPNEIEETVAMHPGVLEVAAVGVPDEKSGEAVKVYIVRKNPALTTQAIKDFCRERLTGYKMPKYVEFRDSLPKTNVGKILRRELRDEAIKSHNQEAK